MLWNFVWLALLWLWYEAKKVPSRQMPTNNGSANNNNNNNSHNNPLTTSSAAVRSCNCCPYGYHIDLDFVRYCEALANAKPSEEELRRRDRRRSRKSMEFMLGFESLFGSDWQAESRVQAKLPEAAHESEPDSPRPVTTSQAYTACYRPRSSSVPRFTYGNGNAYGSATRAESPFGTASSTCSSLRGGVESDAGVYHSFGPGRPANSPPETRAFLHEALDEVCSDFERTLERASVRRRKAGGGSGSGAGYSSYGSMDRNNNSLSNGFGTPRGEKEQRRLGNSAWDRYFDVADSCIAGNRSPRTSTTRLFLRSNTLPLQQRPSPAEVQYESYVQATVAANAKSPVEQLEPGMAPPPPPRRHHHHQPQLLTSRTKEEPETVPSSTPHSPVVSETGAADAQALCQIREQMALSLKRLKDLEEQVKTIPDMEQELNSLRQEKQRLLRRNEELLRTARQTPSPPSPSASKNASPVQFTPQRISPVSLESLGARIRNNSTSSTTAPAAVIRRDVSTMCKATSTRDVAVGSPKLSTRHVGTQDNQTVYTPQELEERIEVALTDQRKQQRQQQLQKLISVGTQMYVPKRQLRDMGTATDRPPLTYNVGVSAKPSTRENYVHCKPDVRSVGSSEHRITDMLCEKCSVSTRSVSCGTELEQPPKPVVSVKSSPLAMARSNTFSLGEHEPLNMRARKAVGCQTLATPLHSTGSQTVSLPQKSMAVQVTPAQQTASTQSTVELSTRQTDTTGLQRLSRSATKVEQVAESVPMPATRHMASNTDAEPAKAATSNMGCNTDAAPLMPPAPSPSRVHSSCNTEQLHTRDVACGDIVKPHISIACADNYCDSCKDAIQHLAKDFSKTSTSTSSTTTTTTTKLTRSSSSDSRIPRPKHLTSPSPVRRQIQRQNTYTLATPSPTSSPSAQQECKTVLSSLQEKPPSLSSFQAPEAASETQSFLQQPAGKPAGPLDLSQLGEHELVVREEKRVSISWSRDASPAPLMRTSGTTSSASNKKSASPESKLTSSSDSSASVALEISQGARKKSSTPLKSSQSDGSQVTVIERETAPTKAQLHKLAMSESEPRQKTEIPKELQDAVKIINNSLLKKLGSKPISSVSLKTAKTTIQDHWFRNSSTGTSNAHEVEDYLDYFESLSVPLLEYCVNLVDKNGNTAMHYAVSHGNFDVVSILLDSKVCNVNQMNNAGYTCVMLVSLAKLKQPAHRTVVERLFQMADVNIRAKKHCQTALMLAVSHGNSDMVAMLLAAGADINIQDEDGSTALMCAAEHGRVDIVKHLLSHPDCDSLVQDVDGSTAFKIAWQAGHRDVGLLLYVHEQMLRSKLPNRGDSARSSLRQNRQPSH
ncbi:KN motif and ankyrin repeat domain-containing protein 2 isoform X2 [Scaptodrosophila lebanonensis]|uniref:KN motif and ankyrin repeat domain-containing protein 2 isoform X2 n=1 Tax=Drosophila lebanonensis TaxID=7225 RepID=A0A6J2TQP2_DROLE|nr:KN motif and ankyrin repeat domain-containing protein 2 isoform X2 [Scaptodrosophila lebanonensis]